jgi:hypothetical protein
MSVRHYPASLTHFGEDADPKDPDSLFLVSMGDHIPLGGFDHASLMEHLKPLSSAMGLETADRCFYVQQTM